MTQQNGKKQQQNITNLAVHPNIIHWPKMMNSDDP